MNLDTNLILVKNQDKTKNIRSWTYNNGRIEITFSNGKTYPYAHNNIKFFKDPTLILPEQGILLVDGKPIEYIKAQIFPHHVRIFYQSGTHEIYDRERIQVIRSVLSKQKCKNCFDYLKKIAHATGLKTNQGQNILGNRYDNIRFVREDSMLAAFLRGSMAKRPTTSTPFPIYPFGFNASQKIAVDQALSKPLSIIEGPPGTGKTQTILNIIANAVMAGESVAVVSNNNSAAVNVREKLQKNGFDFIAACLGNSENKKEFIKEQTALPDLSGWKLPPSEKTLLYQKIKTIFVDLSDRLEKKNTLSGLRQELAGIELENKYFQQFYIETNDFAQPPRPFRKINSKKWLRLWMLFQKHAELSKPINRWERLKIFILFGIANQNIYDLSYEQLIGLCQKKYYSQKIAELQKEINQLSALLVRYSFDKKMKEYVELSMLLFRHNLCKKYENHTRNQYALADLQKHSDVFISDYPVILSTTYSLCGSLSDQFVYDYVIVDEASQVDLATGALTLSCAKKAVIVGDLKQLPNVVDATQTNVTNQIFQQFNLSEAYRYANHSLLLCVSELFPDAPKTLLREHYRCHPKIIDFCNQKFYNNQLIILTEPTSDRMPLLVYKTAPGNHERQRVNRRQIEVIQDEIIPQQNLDAQKDSVGIVTPYRNQTNALQQAFSGTGIKADTVDKFQGQEHDVIILSTVDNEVTAFTDNANRLNVAVSRAVDQLILVVNGNEEKKDTHISDLIAYIKYNNLDVIESEIYSVFDYLFAAYTKQRMALLKGKKQISQFDSENLMYHIICDALNQDHFYKYDVVVHVPLKSILRTPNKLDEKELVYAMNPLTHVDFLIFNKFGKSPALVVEVDGSSFHAAGTRQAERDQMKDKILEKYNLPILRLRTDESRERMRLEEALLKLY